jgi:hypothetical protein
MKKMKKIMNKLDLNFTIVLICLIALYFVGFLQGLAYNLNCLP